MHAGQDLVRANQHFRGLVLSPAEALQLYEAMAACLSAESSGATCTQSEAPQPSTAQATRGATVASAALPSAVTGAAPAAADPDDAPADIADLAPARIFAGDTFLTLEAVRQWGAAVAARLEELTVQRLPWLTRAVVARLARGLYARGGMDVVGSGGLDDGAALSQSEMSEEENEGSEAEGGAVSGDEVEAAALGDGAGHCLEGCPVRGYADNRTPCAAPCCTVYAYLTKEMMDISHRSSVVYINLRCTSSGFQFSLVWTSAASV